tara:strand:- start:408 stop:614 length:207 start_codon:yes stop_codon:yes gene_type:complete
MKYLIVTLACLAIFALSACGDENEEAATPTPDVVEATDVQENDADNTDAVADVSVDVGDDSADTDAAE